MITVKELVKDSKQAYFSHAIAGNLYYRVTIEDGSVWQFAVDMNDKADVGETTFNAQEKAILLMRYINKSLKNNDLVRVG